MATTAAPTATTLRRWDTTLLLGGSPGTAPGARTLSRAASRRLEAPVLIVRDGGPGFRGPTQRSTCPDKEAAGPQGDAHRPASGDRPPPSTSREGETVGPQED